MGEYSAAIATCVKNEAPYLIEWIAWQQLCGFDEIVIYDNGSTDDTLRLLQPIADAGHIVLQEAIDEPGVAPQISAFTAELKRSTATRWIMFADADEFLILRSATSIGRFLEGFPDDVAQICINWRLFGSSGHLAASEEPVVERFLMASRLSHAVNRHVKAISRRSFIKLPTIHAAVMTGGRVVHDDGAPCVLANYGLADRVSHESAYLNHYILKSREEFEAKIARGRGAVAKDAPEKKRANPDVFWRGHNANDERCLVAKSRASELRERMEALRALRT